MDGLDGQLFVLCVFGHAEGENLWHTLRCFEDGAESVCKYKIPRYPAAALSLSLSLSPLSEFDACLGLGLLGLLLLLLGPFHPLHAFRGLQRAGASEPWAAAAVEM
eukprot:COSAG01_NODE_1909_length_8928_cov_64.180315_3_plen_106_part_00